MRQRVSRIAAFFVCLSSVTAPRRAQAEARL
jgi:hypothetical protein